MEKEIKVGVIFDRDNGLKPVWFIYMNNKHNIKEITYRWRVKKGLSYIEHYSVSDGQNLYEITYDRINTIWKLENTYDI